MVTKWQAIKEMSCISNGQRYVIKLFIYFTKLLTKFTHDFLQNDRNCLDKRSRTQKKIF